MYRIGEHKKYHSRLMQFQNIALYMIFQYQNRNFMLINKIIGVHEEFQRHILKLYKTIDFKTLLLFCY